MPVLQKGATSEHILIPNGHDQMPLQKNIFDVIEQLKRLYPDKNFFLSNYDQIFKELEKKITMISFMVNCWMVNICVYIVRIFFITGRYQNNEYRN